MQIGGKALCVCVSVEPGASIVRVTESRTRRTFAKVASCMDDGIVVAILRVKMCIDMKPLRAAQKIVNGATRRGGDGNPI